MKKILILILSLLTLVSCKDFLEEESKSQMTADYYETEKGLKEGVEAVYSSCREIFRENMFRINIFCDIAEYGASEPNYSDPILTDWGVTNSLFCDLHQGIMICNRMEQVIGEPSDRTKEIYLAELRGFRSMFYQYCAELWGKYGHYQNKVYDAYEDSMLYINQVPVATYYKHILSDINYAIDKLPPQSEITEYGRLSQGAAKALKARYLLAIAGYSLPDYNGEEEKDMYAQVGYSSLEQVYQEAYDLANSVINDYGYALCPKYADNFDEKQQDNSEVIWSVQWTPEMLYNGDAPGYHRYGIGRTCEILNLKQNPDGSHTSTTSSAVVTRGGKSFTQPCHSMYYGREYRYYMPSFKWINMYSDKDQRKYDNFETVYYKIDDAVAAPKDFTDTISYMPFRKITLEEDQKYTDWVKSGDEHAYYLDGMNEVYDMDDSTDTKHYGGPLPQRSRYYNVKKFYDRSRVERGKQEEGTKNGTIIRLAEMYLIKAECAFKLGRGEQAVYNELLPLWQRAFTDIKDADAYKPAPGTMDINFIIDEYERELGMEFNSFFILKRTRTLVDRVGSMPISKLDEANKTVTFRGFVEQYGKALYIKPFPLQQARRYKVMDRSMLPPGYDYGNNF